MEFNEILLEREADLIQLDRDVLECQGIYDAKEALIQMMEDGSQFGLSRSDMVELKELGLEIDVALTTQNASLHNYEAGLEAMNVTDNQKKGLIGLALAGLVALLFWVVKKVWNWFKGRKGSATKGLKSAGVSISTIEVNILEAVTDESKWASTLDQIGQFSSFVTDTLTKDKIKLVLKDKKTAEEASVAIRTALLPLTEDFIPKTLTLTNNTKVDSNSPLKDIVTALVGTKINYKSYSLVTVDLETLRDLDSSLESKLTKQAKDLDKLSKENSWIKELVLNFTKNPEKWVNDEYIKPAASFASWYIRSIFIPLVQDAALFNNLNDKSVNDLPKFASEEIINKHKDSSNKLIKGAFSVADANKIETILKAYAGVPEKERKDLISGSYNAYVSYKALLDKVKTRKNSDESK